MLFLNQLAEFLGTETPPFEPGEKSIFLQVMNTWCLPDNFVELSESDDREYLAQIGDKSTGRHSYVG